MKSLSLVHSVDTLISYLEMESDCLPLPSAMLTFSMEKKALLLLFLRSRLPSSTNLHSLRKCMSVMKLLERSTFRRLGRLPFSYRRKYLTLVRKLSLRLITFRLKKLPTITPSIDSILFWPRLADAY
jgi:hypothetical protein